MTADIIPIELGLTRGNGLTLWAPRWFEDGEEWEAFLGHEEYLYVFPTAAELAAFIRTSTEHDLLDHPEWGTAARLLVDELNPDDDHRFDIVGVPDLVAEAPDVWTLATLTDTVAILKSLAEVCDLEAIDNVLGAAPGFSVLSAGEQAFTGRAGERLWNELGAVVVDRWDEVVDALDGIVTTPDVQADALETAQAEAAAIAVAEKVVEGAGVEGTATSDEDDEDDRDEDLEFWDETGVDCLEVTVGERTGWTLRCYLGEDPVFLSQGDRIQIYSSPEALENYLIETDPQHSLASLGVWPDIRTAVVEGDAAVMAGPENTYLLNGLAKDLLAGPENVDRDQLTLGVELLVDAATARGDTETVEALGSSTPLGNLVIIIKPDPARMTPSPPFDDEAAAWSILVDRLVSTLDWDGERQ